jgi:hypothetical protein
MLRACVQHVATLCTSLFIEALFLHIYYLLFLPCVYISKLYVSYTSSFRRFVHTQISGFLSLNNHFYTSSTVTTIITTN